MVKNVKRPAIKMSKDFPDAQKLVHFERLKRYRDKSKTNFEAEGKKTSDRIRYIQKLLENCSDAKKMKKTPIIN